MLILPAHHRSDGVDEEVILLALLDQHIGALDEVIGGGHVLRIADLFLIDTDASALDLSLIHI